MIEILKGKVVPQIVDETEDVFTQVYNPDVLLCLANLSNDEVFTPPEIANQMLDMLPQELFKDPNTKYLDPACKSGVFLREIAKRLIKGLEEKIPDIQERIDHICKEQLYGIAITELTSLLSRRSVYCSKYPNGPFSIAHFDNVEGNIRYKNCKHEWIGEPKKWTYVHGEKVRVWRKCKCCGASEELFGDEHRNNLEYHAYEFIHVLHPKEIFDMKFDVIISNPPYQIDTEGAGRQAKPIYHLFVNQAKKLNPRFLTMIIPSRWFSGGMGLDSFRETMKADKHVRKITDFTNAKECFPSNSVSGGVCYFLWDRDNEGDCEFTNIINGEQTTAERNLDEFPVLVRYNRAIGIIHKVIKDDNKLADITSGLMPFGLSTSYRGQKERDAVHCYPLHASNGVTYIARDEFSKGEEYLNGYKILISKTSAEHAGEPGKDGMFRIIPSSMKVLTPTEVCTHSYFLIGPFENKSNAENALTYMKTRFVRFLMLLSMSGFGLSKQVMGFVPSQDFSKSWTDKELYKKYNLTREEIEFIESMIRKIED